MRPKVLSALICLDCGRLPAFTLASLSHNGQTDLLKPKSGPVSPLSRVCEVSPHSEHKPVLTITLWAHVHGQPLPFPSSSPFHSSCTWEHLLFPLPDMLFPGPPWPPSLSPDLTSQCGPPLPPKNCRPTTTTADTFYSPSLNYFAP